jgi:hypothetical protein
MFSLFSGSGKSKPQGRRPDPADRMLDVAGMIRQASSTVPISELLKLGKKQIQVLSQERIQELINRAVRTIVAKHIADEKMATLSAEQIAAESKSEFQELLDLYQQSTRAKDDVERSRQSLDEEMEKLRKELEGERAASRDRQVEATARAVAPEPTGSPKENANLQKRIEKLNEYVASLEKALKTLSNTKLLSNQQIQNVLRQLGLVQEDKYFEKKKEALKLVLEANQSVRKQARELEEQGITLANPRGRVAPVLAAAAREQPAGGPVAAATMQWSPSGERNS